MNVVFDIDDTIVDETEFILKHAPAYLRRKYNVCAEVKNPNGYNLSEIFGLCELFRSDIECRGIENEFWNKVFFRYVFSRCKKGVRKTVKGLKKKGIHIYFVTCRGKRTRGKRTRLNEWVRLQLVPSQK